jgi:hypothetical protein
VFISPSLGRFSLPNRISLLAAWMTSPHFLYPDYENFALVIGDWKTVRLIAIDHDAASLGHATGRASSLMRCFPRAIVCLGAPSPVVPRQCHRICRPSQLRISSHDFISSAGTKFPHAAIITGGESAANWLMC